jgi:hypothetical protein
MTNSLVNLEYIPYINDQGLLPTELQGKIGVYAIFDQKKALQFIGYSRDIYLSLKQHLIRQTQLCYWLKVYTIERPSRTILEEIKTAWIAENGTIHQGNQQENIWNEPIDIRPQMTAEEKAKFPNLMELDQSKLLKNVARRIEKEILSNLKNRGLTEEFRFNPKRKDDGFLDLK